MEIEKLRAFLRRHSRIALDTPVFIYQMQAHPRYLACTNYIFDWIEQSRTKALTSTITMTELLVYPYRNNNEKAADDFRGLLSTYPNLEWIAPDLGIAVTAARIRALHRLETPDALQAATAQLFATALITNDSIFKRVKGFETLTLDQLV